MPFFYTSPEAAAWLAANDSRSVRPLVMAQAGVGTARRRRLYFAAGTALALAAICALAAWRPTTWSSKPSAEHIDETMQAFGKRTAAAKWGRKPTLRVDAPLNAARGRYSEEAVRAFAALAKVSYCGPLPGVFSSVALTCSSMKVPGVTSVCEPANFEVVPGTVRAFQASDNYRPDAIFGYVAKVRPTAEGWSAVSPGVVVVFRGSIDNMANNERDKETTLVRSNHTPGSVHGGYHETYDKVAPQIQGYLNELWCKENCTVHVTGHGSGAALAQLAAGELLTAGYAIGASYLFSSPMVGDANFAKGMNGMFDPRKSGPIFEVVEGKESAARWPFDSAFRPWGIQAYYSDKEATKATVICHSDDPLCGINNVPKNQLTHQDVCDSAIAPDKSFCDFNKDFVGECYGGIAFHILNKIRQDFENFTNTTMPSTAPEQPVDQEASKWHPSQGKGEQTAALAREKRTRKPEHLFNIETLKAMATLSKIAYCGSSAAFKNVVVSSCTGEESVCAKAGFGVVPHSVKPVSVPDQSNPEAMFFYTALAHRTAAKFAQAPYFMPSETCLLVFRGTANQENMAMNNGLAQVSVEDPACKTCTVSKGINRVWEARMGDLVVQALNASGCTPRPTPSTTNKVIIAGHSMGGTVATLAAYKLHRLGFDIELSWALEGGRPGNAAFMDYINNKAFSKERSVPMWLVTHSNDGITRWPKQVDGVDAGRLEYHVHFEANSLANPKICTSAKLATAAGGCGIFQYPRANLTFNLPNHAHCALPYAPGGMMCMAAGVPAPFPYSMARQCTVGGAMPQ